MECYLYNRLLLIIVITFLCLLKYTLIIHLDVHIVYEITMMQHKLHNIISTSDVTKYCISIMIIMIEAFHNNRDTEKVIS